MRKDTAIIAGLTAVLTTAIVGGGHYMTIVRHPPMSSPDNADALQDLSPRRDQSTGDAISMPDVSAETSQERKDTAIKCHDPKRGEFWTNATTCEGADLDNRLSTYTPVPSTLDTDRNTGWGDNSPSQPADHDRANRKPDLRVAGKSPPYGTPAKCRFPLGQASEFERTLAAAGDPYESIWRENYCEFRCEAIREHCPVSVDYFYYDFEEMCEGTEHYPCFGSNG